MKYQDKESICMMLEAVRSGLDALRATLFDTESGKSLIDKYSDVIASAITYINEKTIEVEDAHR
jgi:adenine-specific DNA methylase